MTRCNIPVLPKAEPLTEDDILKLNRHVEEDHGYSTPCHIWQGATVNSGYGHVAIAGLPPKMSLAHRVSYIAAHGSIPDNLTIDHLCRVRLCINPEHLEAVTLAENIRRAAATKTACPHGHPYSADNMIKGTRKCRQCDNARGRANYRKRKEMAA